jgi:Nucleotide-diphospho-sugar transferase
MKEWAIVLFATGGLDDFVENALKGMTACGIDTDLVRVIIPANAKDKLFDLIESLGATGCLLEFLTGVQDTKLPNRYAAYDSAEFRRLMGYRFPILRSLLKEHKRVIHADLDVAWLRNPLPYLVEVLKRYPWACQTEAVAQFPPAFCLGFYAVRSSPQAFDLIDRHIAAYEGDPGNLTDQELFNRFVRERPDAMRDIFPLPEALFANGLLYRALRPGQKARGLLIEEAEPFVFHANWTIGIENKRRLLKEAGAWHSSIQPPDRGL